MKAIIRNGKFILLADMSFYNPQKLYKATETSSRKILADIEGNIYSYDYHQGQIKKLVPVMNSNTPTIILKSKGKRKKIAVKELVVRAFFAHYPHKTSQVGHLDNDRNNCKPTNLFIDITPRDVDETIY